MTTPLKTYEFTCPNCAQHYECGIRPGLSFMCQKCSFTFMPQIENERLAPDQEAAIEAVLSVARASDLNYLHDKAEELDGAAGTSYALGWVCLVGGGVVALLVGNEWSLAAGAGTFFGFILLRCLFSVLERLASINATVIRIQKEVSRK